MEGTITSNSINVSQIISCYETMKEENYDKLIEFSEIDENVDADECENALDAMEHILAHGTCSDVAHGLRYFISFLHAKNDIHVMKN